jgi:hypothetical protein
MNKILGATALLGAFVMIPASTYGQSAAEVFTATAVVKTADGKSASAPLTITIDRKMSESEAGSLANAFKAGGAAALRKGLEGVKPTGTVRIGAGRLLTILTDQPLLFVGAAAPGAKPREGYDFAVIDIEVDAQGNGSGTLAPAARLRLNQSAFVVEDYGAEVVRLTAVKKTK